MKKIIYLCAAAALASCGSKTPAGNSELPGTYGRYKDLGTAHVWDTIVIGKADGASERFNVVQRIIKERMLDSTWLPKEYSEEKMDGIWDEGKSEIYFEQQGKTYTVDLKNQLLTDQVDTFRRAASFIK